MNNLKTIKIESTTGTVYYNDKLYRRINKRIDNTMRGAAILRQLGQYGFTLRENCLPEEESPLRIAIVIEPPRVYICLSEDKLDGVFIDFYSQEIYGIYSSCLTKSVDELFDSTLHRYSDYWAKLDGWNFWAIMLSQA